MKLKVCFGGTTDRLDVIKLGFSLFDANSFWWTVLVLGGFLRMAGCSKPSRCVCTLSRWLRYRQSLLHVASSSERCAAGTYVNQMGGLGGYGMSGGELRMVSTSPHSPGTCVKGKTCTKCLEPKKEQ